ncbi:hypothetical protein OOZ54_23285 [Rhodopseudomonas palustris]|uniref:hypothetical protein n=1 Tax=Rhodopseudomonas palustris TaxID=1076 RepID=UPI000E5A7195|nr:hypothetical protein [Rhodopseudomonas palustris]RIA02344.1 hypothetical protein D1920_08125 [Rhodopseudomonas palustris]WBU29547.1 hypothetical protein OOZ54_23285 [Rhodopseudomonas palustris]
MIATKLGDSQRGRSTRIAMASKSSTIIARRARTRAEADFATWLMMAKLGSFDSLPENAQKVLNGYRERLDRMSEIESKTIAVRETYQAYYSDMGGTGEAPEPEPRSPPPADRGEAVVDNVVRFKKPQKPKVTRIADRGARPTPPSGTRRPIPALLIFAALCAIVVAWKFLTK